MGGKVRMAHISLGAHTDTFTGRHPTELLRTSRRISYSLTSKTTSKSSSSPFFAPEVISISTRPGWEKMDAVGKRRTDSKCDNLFPVLLKQSRTRLPGQAPFS